MDTVRDPDDDRRKGLIEEVLRGEVTAKTHPHFFLDDILFHAVLMTDTRDPLWLPGILSQRGWDLAGVKAVAGCLSESRREALRPLLGVAADGFGW
jgi:hypothetical protein